MKQIFFIVIVNTILLTGCIEPYSPPEISNAEALQVIDASLNGETGSGTVTLRNSSSLNEPVDRNFTIPATVRIEDESNNQYPFTAVGNGVYSINGLALTAGERVRLIVIIAGKTFQSDYVEYKETPQIDSVSWKAKSDGVQLYVSTHDPHDNSIYYKWDYEETWEIEVPFASKLFFENVVYHPGNSQYTYHVAIRDNPNELKRCYRYNISGNIVIATSESLQKDVIYEYPITFVPSNDQKLTRRYSLLVRQKVLQKNAYKYWKSLRETTEGLGGLFDPQPYAIESNVKNIDNPSETVLGYFQVYSEREKRIFITPGQLPQYHFFTGFEDCALDSTFLGVEGREPDPTAPYLIYDALVNTFSDTTGYLVTSPYCGDCRESGSPVKPPFW